jgi:glycosyltransferase involved in cell wall biosynthesis
MAMTISLLTPSGFAPNNAATQEMIQTSVFLKIAIINQPHDFIAAAEEQRGSVSIVNWELARRLSERHDVTIYAPRASGQPAVERFGNICIRRVDFVARYFHKAFQLVAGRLQGRRPYAHTRLYYRKYYLEIAAALRQHPVDIVHFPTQLQFARDFRAAAPNARIVMHMHQDELAHLDESYLRGNLSFIDSIVTVSDHVTKGARRRLPELAERIHTIGNGVDIRRFQPDSDRHQSRQPCRLLFVGRISPDKGVHVLMKAFDAVARERPDLELTLIGKPGMMPMDVLSVLLKEDAALEAVRDFYGRSTFAWLTKEVLGQRSSYLGHVKTLLSSQTAARAHFRGTVSLSELQKLYQQADLLILPSIWQESYGLPVAEAMASGVPVLATRSGGVPELVEDGVSGRLVPRFEVGALTYVMREMLADPDRLRAMGRAARTRAEQLLTWERSARRLEEVYLRSVGESDHS